MFCSNCGKEIPAGSKFCPGCGKTADAAANVSKTASASGPAEPQAADPNDAEQNKGMAILAYILFFIPLLVGTHKTSDFVKYHTNQGTILFLATVVFSIVLGILTAILTAILLGSGAWRLWGVISVIFGLLWFVPLVLCILGIVNAATGKMKPLPVIGKFTIIK
jgi:uncharacterized membrane protein